MAVSGAWLACRQIAGINPITYSADAAGDGGCTLGTPLFTSTSNYNVLAVQGGFVYLDITGSGVSRCASTGCAGPLTIVTVPNTVNDTYQSFGLASALLYYTFQSSLTADGGAANGELHSVGLDGTGDKAVLTNLAYPLWVATSGSRIFWVDDPLSGVVPGTNPATVNCIGCIGSGSTPWITQLGMTFGLLADQNNVYVLEDDGTGTATDKLVACGTQTACAAAPRTVVPSLTSLTPPEIANVASDGTYAYVARPSHSDVVRVDGAGAVVSVVTGHNVYAVAVDGNGNLYYATDTGYIFRTRADGSDAGAAVALVCNQTSITDIAVDAQNVYFLAGTTSGPYFAPL